MLDFSKLIRIGRHSNARCTLNNSKPTIEFDLACLNFPNCGLSKP